MNASKPPKLMSPSGNPRMPRIAIFTNDVCSPLSRGLSSSQSLIRALQVLREVHFRRQQAGCVDGVEVQAVIDPGLDSLFEVIRSEEHTSELQPLAYPLIRPPR